MSWLYCIWTVWPFRARAVLAHLALFPGLEGGQANCPVHIARAEQACATETTRRQRSCTGEPHHIDGLLRVRTASRASVVSGSHHHVVSAGAGEAGGHAEFMQGTRYST